VSPSRAKLPAGMAESTREGERPGGDRSGLRDLVRLSRRARRGVGRQVAPARLLGPLFTPIIVLALLLPLSAVLFVGCGGGLVGRAAPAFIGTSLDGTKVSLSEYRGKPLVLAFMASW